MACKNNINGIKQIFLTPYKKLPRWYFLKGGGFSGEIKITPIQLQGATAKQTFKDMAYDQSLSLKIPNLENKDNLKDFESGIYRAVVTDNMNRYWLIGKENGITLSSISSDVGSSKKAFSGYDLTFKGIEIEVFSQLTNIDGFIEDAVLFLSSSNEKSSSSKLISDIYI